MVLKTGVENIPAATNWPAALAAIPYMDSLLIGQNAIIWEEFETSSGTYVSANFVALKTALTQYSNGGAETVLTVIPQSSWGCEAGIPYPDGQYWGKLRGDPEKLAWSAFIKALVNYIFITATSTQPIKAIVIGEEVENHIAGTGTASDYEELLTLAHEAIQELAAERRCEVWHSGTNLGTTADDGLVSYSTLDSYVWRGGSYDSFCIHGNRDPDGVKHFIEYLNSRGITNIALDDAASINPVASDTGHLGPEDIQVLADISGLGDEELAAYYLAHQPGHVAKICAYCAALNVTDVMFTTFYSVPSSPFTQIKYGGVFDIDGSYVITEKAVMDVIRFFNDWDINPTTEVTISHTPGDAGASIYFDNDDHRGWIMWGTSVSTNAPVVRVTDLTTMREFRGLVTGGTYTAGATPVWVEETATYVGRTRAAVAKLQTSNNTPPAESFAIGENVETNSPYAISWSFVDQIKRIGLWYHLGTASEEAEQAPVRVPVDTNEQGYPTYSQASAGGSYDPPTNGIIGVLCTGLGDAPPGNGADWTFSFTGTGKVKFESNTQNEEWNHDTSTTTTVSNIEAPGSGGYRITIYPSNSGTLDITEMHLWMPDFEPGGTRNPNGDVIYHPLFLERLAVYTGALRYMDWCGVNRCRPNYGTYSNDTVGMLWAAEDGYVPTTAGTPRPSRSAGTGEIMSPGFTCRPGVAPEYMAELANAVYAAGGTDTMWINLPCGGAATQDYIESMATILANTLDDHIKLIIEYGNEIWNDGFPCYHYFKVVYSGDNTWNAAAKTAVGTEAQIVYPFFLSAWAAAGKDVDRIERYLPGRLGNTDYFTYVVQGYNNNNYEAIGCTWYMGLFPNDEDHRAPHYGPVGLHYFREEGDPDPAPEPWDLNIIFERMNERFSALLGYLKFYKEHALNNNKKLYHYEGGQHLAPYVGFKYLSPWFANCSYDPRMKDIYNRMFTLFDEEVYEEGHAFEGEYKYKPDLACHYFSAATYMALMGQGSFGALTEQNEDLTNTPEYPNQKFIALLRGRSVGALLDNE
jgi:hypothetical protein